MANDPPDSHAPDPEEARVGELLQRVRADQASDAEREELALYVADRPELAPRVQQQQQAAQLGGTWLARVEADRKLAEAESTPLVKAERGLGLAMTIGGFALLPVMPAASVIGMLGGAALLTWSYTRVRLKTFKDDPYRDIDK